MKTREERAREYISQLAPGWVGKAAGDQFEAIHIAGAESEHAELTRWNNPKEVLPDEGTEVLVKYQDKMVLMACYENSEFGWHCYEPRNSRWYALQDNIIVGWRNIDY